jgi:hypothetical protein
VHLPLFVFIISHIIMTQKHTNCPVCEGKFGLCREFPTRRDSRAFQCDGCGGFEISGIAFAVWFAPGRQRMTTMQRSALSHAIRSASGGAEPVFITTDWMEAFQRDARLPTPATQAANLIARIGDHVAEEGKGYFIDDVTDTPLVGAFDRTMFNDLLRELVERDLVRRLDRESIPNPRDVGVLEGFLYGLSLAGWERFEAEKRGRFAGHYGFIAMKFGDPVLDPLVRDFIKPAVQERIGYDLIDLRNVSRAGVIDNIMRTQIRDAAFVLVDLTHDNSGAYWEAGYGEGLGKPVIYMCEQSKFDTETTHFDTNHCTTVTWSINDPEPFVDRLVATLRRSLNLFPSEATP